MEINTKNNLKDAGLERYLWIQNARLFWGVKLCHGFKGGE